MKLSTEYILTFTSTKSNVYHKIPFCVEEISFHVFYFACLIYSLYDEWDSVYTTNLPGRA